MSRTLLLPALVLVVALAGCTPTVPTPTPTPEPTFAVTGDGELVIGTLFETRQPVGAAEVAGVEVAVREINAAGGVLGVPVRVFHRDGADAASEAALLEKGADLLIGSAASTAPDVAAVAVDPGAATTDEAFIARLRQVDPALTTYEGAVEAYTATIEAALAAVLADDDGGPAITRLLPAVTADGIPCGSFGECIDTLLTQTNIAYAQHIGAA